MKVFIALVFAFLVAAAPLQAAEKAAFSSIHAELPLMPGLVEKPDSLVMFDKPEGRIAEITMTSAKSQIEVLGFYRETLPSLGWYGENPQIWTRGGEQLTIRFNDDRSVVFHIEPASSRGRSSFRDSTVAPAPAWEGKK